MWDAVKHFTSAQPELISLISLGCGAASIVLAFILYRASKQRRLLAYATRTFRIISDKARGVNGLRVLYGDEPVRSLSVTRLGMWNAGNEVLRRTDIPSRHPPVIYAKKGVCILEAQLLETTSLANGIQLTPFEGEISGYAVMFEFLDPNDGALISIAHDGIEVDDIVMSGSIIGGHIRRRATDPETPNKSIGLTTVVKDSGRSSAQELAIFSLCFLPLGILAAFFDLTISVGIIMGNVIACGIVYVKSRISYPPSRLKMFDDNLEPPKSSQ